MSFKIDADFRSVSDFVAGRVAEEQVPSIAVGISIDGEPVLAEAWGFANLDAGIRATCDTPYSIASITKPMAGTLLAILAERGVISLDSPVNEYIGSVKLTAREGSVNMATVGRLANHTAGLPMYYQFFFDDDPVAPPGYAETIRRYGKVMRPPGERYVYSNIAYGILGHLIEYQFEKPLAEVYRDELFQPLGMTTALFAPDVEDRSRYAIRYDGAPSVPIPHYVTDHPAASEAFASVNDLLEFGKSHLGKNRSPVLSRESVLAMQQTAEGSPDVNYGLGWSLSTTASGERYVAHSGGMPGVSTRLGLVPDRGIVFTVLCNSGSPIVEEVTSRICEALDIYFEPGNPEPSALTPSPGMVGRWTGEISTYEGASPMLLTVDESGKCAVRLDGAEAECDAAAEGALIQGAVEAQLRTSDAMRTAHDLQLDLTYREDRITGFATAISTEGLRIRNALAYPARLDRAGC